MHMSTRWDLHDTALLAQRTSYERYRIYITNVADVAYVGRFRCPCHVIDLLGQIRPSWLYDLHGVYAMRSGWGLHFTTRAQMCTGWDLRDAALEQPLQTARTGSR